MKFYIHSSQSIIVKEELMNKTETFMIKNIEHGKNTRTFFDLLIFQKYFVFSNRFSGIAEK